MTANDWSSSNANADATSTLGPRFGWSLTYDPKIKVPGNAPDTPETVGKITKIHDGKVDVQMSDGSTKSMDVPTITYQDEDGKGKPFTNYRIDKKKAGSYVRTVTDEHGHTYDEIVVQASQKDMPNSENGSQIMQDYALKAQSSNPQDRQQFIDLQAKLEGIGLLPKGKYLKGLPDDATQQALQSAIVMADRTGQSLDDILNDPQAIASAKTATGPTRPRLANPDEVAASAKKAAFETIGKPIDPGTLNQIQSRASSLQQQTYTDPDGNIQYYDTGSPSEAWLQQQIQDLLPQTTKAYSEFQGLGNVQQLLGTSSSPIGNLYHE